MSEDAAVTDESTRPEPAGTPDEVQPAGQGAQSEVQSELDLGVVSTGSPDVDAALQPLDQLAERPVAEHPEVYDRVLEALTATMTAETGEASAQSHGDG